MISFSITSSDGATPLACYRTDTKNPRALVQISHGMCEYFLRYADWAEALSREGFLVFGHDHLGHGHTAPDPDSLGFIASENGADRLVEDLHNLSLSLKQQYPGLPLILFGHSMGSFIAREALARYGRTYSAAILSGTAGPDMPTGAGRALASILARFQGERHRSKLLKGIAFGGYNKRYPSVKTPMDWLTRDESVVERYLADPLCNYVFTIRAFADLFTLIGWVSRADWASRLPDGLPILLVSGLDDPVGGWGQGVKKVADRLSAAKKNATLRLYPDMRHELLNELGRETVWKELLQWMNTFST